MTLLEKKGFSFSKILIFIILCLISLTTVAPLFFMISASLMPAIDIVKIPFRWIPESLYLDNYIEAIAGHDKSYIFVRNSINSFIVAGACTLTTIFLSSLTGYGLAKFRFKGRNIIFMMIMATMMIPFQAIMIPLYIVVLQLDFMNTYQGLIIPFLVTAFGVFLMRQYLLTFPDEYLDAARMDGMGEFSIFVHIIFPNSGPVIAVLAILTFRTHWDNLLWPLLIVKSEVMKTIPLYVVKFRAEMSANDGALMAVAVIASIPIFILFFSLSKYFFGGSSVYSSRKG